MPFKKGHSGYKGYRKKTGPNINEGKKPGNASLNTYYQYKNRWTTTGKNLNYLDPELVDYYIMNDLDLGELLDRENEHGNRKYNGTK